MNDIEQINDRIKELKNVYTGQLLALINKLERNDVDLASRLMRLHEEAPIMIGRFNQIDSTLTAMNAKIELSICKSEDSTDGKLEAIKKEISEQKEEMKDVHMDYGMLYKNVKEFKEELNEIKDEIVEKVLDGFCEQNNEIIEINDELESLHLKFINYEKATVSNREIHQKRVLSEFSFIGEKLYALTESAKEYKTYHEDTLCGFSKMNAYIIRLEKQVQILAACFAVSSLLMLFLVVLLFTSAV